MAKRETVTPYERLLRLARSCRRSVEAVTGGDAGKRAALDQRIAACRDLAPVYAVDLDDPATRAGVLFTLGVVAGARSNRDALGVLTELAAEFPEAAPVER